MEVSLYPQRTTKATKSGGYVVSAKKCKYLSYSSNPDGKWSQRRETDAILCVLGQVTFPFCKMRTIIKHTSWGFC